MSKSYTSRHARLAANGINILNVVPISDSMTAVLFEYCWEDPKVPDKLRWNKSYISITENSGDVAELLIERVTAARAELERGE